MTLDEASKSEIPLAIEIGDMKRPLAALFVLTDGIAFADTGWPEVGSHPFHVINGNVSGEGPWDVGNAVVSVIDHGDQVSEAWNTWVEWCEWQQADGKDWQDRETIAAAIMESGIVNPNEVKEAI